MLTTVQMFAWLETRGFRLAESPDGDWQVVDTGQRPGRAFIVQGRDPLLVIQSAFDILIQSEH